MDIKAGKPTYLNKGRHAYKLIELKEGIDVGVQTDGHTDRRGRSYKDKYAQKVDI